MRFFSEDTVLQLKYLTAAHLTKVFVIYSISIIYCVSVQFLISCSRDNQDTPFENRIWHP